MSDVQGNVRRILCDLRKVCDRMKSLSSDTDNVMVLHYCLQPAIKVSESSPRSPRFASHLKEQKFKNTLHMIEYCSYDSNMSAIREVLQELPMYLLLGLAAMIRYVLV